MNLTTIILSSNNTSVTNGTTISPTIGFLSCLVSAVGFAVNYLPVKRYETGDGMFFQWILSNAIFAGSFIVAAIYKFPKFQPLVMVGGLLWSTGNICVVPVVQRIGLGMGMLIWGSVSLVFGWASARFGWFGVDKQYPNNFTLNYIGFTFTAVSPLLYALVKTNLNPIRLNENVQFENVPEAETTPVIVVPTRESVLEILKRSLKSNGKIIGVFLSFFSGALYGFTFIPVIYVKNRFFNSSQKDIEYLFAQCSGIYIGSTLYFLVYCIIKRNKPILYPKAILPATMSGLIWLIAYIAYFIANEALSPAITQPIVVAVSGSISTLINVIVFREVKGIRNYMIIVVAIIVTAAGTTLVGISKVM